MISDSQWDELRPYAEAVFTAESDYHKFIALEAASEILARPEVDIILEEMRANLCIARADFDIAKRRILGTV